MAWARRWHSHRFARVGAGSPAAASRPRITTMLGYDAADAGDTVYAQGAPLPFRQVGATCRLCEHHTCARRSAPALTQAIAIADYVTGPAASELF